MSLALLSLTILTTIAFNRYVSAPEAFWRIFGFDMSERHPSVVRLTIHLENEQIVTYHDGQEEAALRNAEQLDTQLTAYFNRVALEERVPLDPNELGRDSNNQPYPSALQLTYVDFPTYYAWTASDRTWIRRSRPKKSDCIGRVYNIHPSSGDLFYLRLLLHSVQGASSFVNLRTVDGVVYPTFRDACAARNLLADDEEWKQTLREAVFTNVSALSIRKLFVYILLNCTVASPIQLWEYRIVEQNRGINSAMADDFRVQRLNNPLYQHLDEEDDVQQALHSLNELITELSNGTKTLASFGLPQPQNVRRLEDIRFVNNIDLQNEELQLNQHAVIAANNEERLNVDQQLVYQRVNEVIRNRQHRHQDGPNPLIERGHVFFIDAPGGTGKTFLFTTIYSKWKSERMSILSVASSGIASILLPAGKTAHSQFAIPLICGRDSFSKITPLSNIGRTLIAADIILWDEISMASKYMIEVVDKLLKKLTHNDSLFGGKIVIFAGDFRQTAPVVKGGSPEQVIEISLKKWEFWPSVETLRLTINERARRGGNLTVEDENFVNFLMDVGNGAARIYHNLRNEQIILPAQYMYGIDDNNRETMEGFIRFCYPEISVQRFQAPSDVAILTSKNSDADAINDIALDLMEDRNIVELRSADSIQEEESDEQERGLLFPVDYLNTVNIPGFPVHNLRLKIGAPVILLRNLDTASGLCNGTRLIILEISPRLLKARICGGAFDGAITTIPRIDLYSAPNVLPFTLHRRQFPVRLAFSITINKSQGQTLSRVGLYLPNPVFTHGQLYVGLSRCGNWRSIKILMREVPDKQGLIDGLYYTKNIVFRPLLERR